jgi:hypothetical protein
MSQKARRAKKSSAGVDATQVPSVRRFGNDIVCVSADAVAMPLSKKTQERLRNIDRSVTWPPYPTYYAFNR